MRIYSKRCKNLRMCPIRKEKTKILVATLGVLAAALFLWGVCGASGDFIQALGPREFRFPEDHADHPGFQTEWWYYTGNLISNDDRAFG
ncbi:MAG: hypothetical protein KAT27_08880, partial [Desulfobacterales bacterium]|nr:hypothetical protein [Desulfobacterales bacterium]